MQREEMREDRFGKKQHQEVEFWDFPDGPVVKTLPSNTESMGSIPGQGAKIPYAWKPRNQNVKQRQN